MIDTLARRLDVSPAEVESILRATGSHVAEHAARDESIRLPGLGTFVARHRDAGRGFLPTLRRFVHLPPRRRIAFRPGAYLESVAKGFGW